MIIMKVQPGQIVPITDSKVVADSHVQIIWTVIWYDNRVWSIWFTWSPPMNNISFFDFNHTIHPIHWCFWWIQLFDYFMLFSSIVSFNLVLLYVFQSYKICSILEACQLNLIPSQMNDRIWENINYLCEHLSYQFVCLIQTYIQRAHVSTSKCTCNILILWCFSPACCMSGCIKLRNNSHTSDHRVSYQLSCIICCVSLLFTKSSILCNLWMRIQN